MSNNLAQTRTLLVELTGKAVRVCNDRSLSEAHRKSKLDSLDREIEAATSEITDLEFVEARKMQIFGNYDGLDAASENLNPNRGRDFMNYGTKIGLVKSAAELAPLNLSEYDLRQLHEAVSSRKSFKLMIDRKAAQSSADYVIPTRAQTLGALHEPTRIMSLFPGAAMDASVKEYVRVNGTTNPATVVAPGGLKPDVGLDSEKLEARATKIAGTISTDDESLADFDGWAAILSVELANAVISAENLQLLRGDGTGINMTGVLATSGVLVHAKGADTSLDAIEIAIQMLRSGASHADADRIVLNPIDLSQIRRSKATGTGAYLAADPIGGLNSSLWDVPISISTDVPVGTALVGAFGLGGFVYVREGLSVQTGLQAGDFEHNLSTMRGEERIALAITRPSCFAVVTGLAA